MRVFRTPMWARTEKMDLGPNRPEQMLMLVLAALM